MYITGRVTSKLSTCITDDLLCVCSCKNGSAYTGCVVNGRIARVVMGTHLVCSMYLLHASAETEPCKGERVLDKELPTAVSILCMKLDVHGQNKIRFIWNTSYFICSLAPSLHHRLN